MKRIFILFFIAMISMNLSAQLFFSNRNVIILNDLNKDQLELSWQRAKVTTYVGGGMILAGTAIFIAGTAINKNSEPEDNSKQVSEYVQYGGAIICGLGIPILIDGIRRKRDLEIMLMKFETSTTMINGIGIKVNF